MKLVSLEELGKGELFGKESGVTYIASKARLLNPPETPISKRLT